MRSAFLGLLLVTAGPAAGAQQPRPPNDPYIWLEDVSGQRPMDWVNSHNAKTQGVLEADSRYQQYYNDALEIAQATGARVVAPTFDLSQWFAEKGLPRPQLSFTNPGEVYRDEGITVRVGASFLAAALALAALAHLRARRLLA